MSTRREPKARGGKSSKALEDIKAARAGAKRSEQYVVNEDKIYDEVDEEEYSEKVEKIRKRKFIEDDDGLGYDDGGELEIDYEDPNDYDEEFERPRKQKEPRKRGALNAQPKPKQIPIEEGSQKITRMLGILFFYYNFQASAPTTRKKEKASVSDRLNSATDSKTSALNIDDLLSNPGQMAGKKKKGVKRKRTMPPTIPDSSMDTSDSQTPSESTSSSQSKENKKEEGNALPPNSTLDIDDVFGGDPMEVKDDPPPPSRPSVERVPDKEHKQQTISFQKAAPTPSQASHTPPPPQTEPIKVPTAPLPVDETISSGVTEWRRFGSVEDDESPLTTPTLPTGEQLEFYWIDAIENRYAQPGTIYLFGKVRIGDRWGSCSVVVPNILRKMFVAPREGVEVEAVGREIEEIRKENKISALMAKAVNRTYTFDDPDVSRDPNATFLKVKYSYKEPALPADISGKTFSRIYGTQTSALENFLVSKRLMGPSWLCVANYSIVPSESQRTHCALEVTVEDLSAIKKIDKLIPLPPLVGLSLSMKVVSNPQTHANEIVALSGVVHRSISPDNASSMKGAVSHFSYVRKLDGQIPMDFDKTVQQKNLPIKFCGSERALLGVFIGLSIVSLTLEKLKTIDPDILVGHNFIGYDLDILLHRMSSLKVVNWSRLGRLKRSVMPKLQAGAGGLGDSTWEEKAITGGRLVCDTYLSAKDLLPREKNYKLSELARSQLGAHRAEVEAEDFPKYFLQTESLLRLIQHTENDAYLSMALMCHLMVIPLTNQLTCLAGNLWARSLTGGRAERNEYLLLHELHNLKYIVPDKQSSKEPQKKKKAGYAGGLVLEPRKGFHDKIILLLDFNSLYPSIIQEFNVCFTTVDRRKDEKGEWEQSEPPPSGGAPGILPRVIRTFVERRRSVKSLIKSETDPLKLQQLDIRQRALKLTANSMYGCLGYPSARFYAKPLAELITRKGRETLSRTAQLAAHELRLEVIYGDTDSIMVDTKTDDFEKAMEIGNRIKVEVNKASKHLEIEIDGVYQPMLLLTKKNYAALKLEKRGTQIIKTKEVKGLHIVRRDWCELSKDMGTFVLDEVLSGKPREDVINNIHDALRRVSEEIRSNAIPLSKYVITKGLTKAPEEYPDSKGQPHVQVALKLKQAGKSVRVGDYIQYVICQGDDPLVAQRAFHPDHILRSDGLLKVDADWYLSSQLHPPIARLCEGLEGTNSAQLAFHLGLDPSKFNKTVHHDSTDEGLGVTALVSKEERFKNVERFAVPCKSCGTVNTFNLKAAYSCSSCQQSFPPFYLRNLVTHFVRQHVTRHYEGWTICDEPSCANRTRQTFYKKTSKCIIPGCRGMALAEYSEEELRNQILYLAHIFEDEPLSKERSAKDKVEEYMNVNTLNFVNLGSLFSMFVKS